jgi:hypothetical protein
MLGEGVGVCAASSALGCGHTAMYQWRNDDAAFRAEWDAAVEVATELVESVLYRQAREGNLLACIFWLKSHKPSVYNRKMQVAIGGDPDAPPIGIEHDVVKIFQLSDNGRDRPFAELEAEDEPEVEEPLKWKREAF